MSLSCICDDDVAWYYSPPDDYTSYTGRRATRCCSCRAPIKPGATALRFNRWRAAEGDIEERIHGDGGEVWLADWWMCETCGDLYWSLNELGYCINLGYSMRELVSEYADQHRPRVSA